MSRCSKFAVVCGSVLVLILAAQASRADDAVNPAYAGWAKFKPGTSVKYASVTDAMNTKTNTEMTQTLVELTPEKATIENKTSMVIAGNKMNMPAQKLDIPAKIATTTPPPATPPADANAPAHNEGTEDVKIGDKTYSCKWAAVTTEQNGLKSVTKTWTCDDVPGKLVKMEATTSGSMASTTTMTLVSVDTK